VTCICGANFKVNTTVPGPLKVETCNQCHPAFNKDRVVKKVVKGRMEKFLEKEKKMASIKKKK
jgi:ribosomal protein L31